MLSVKSLLKVCSWNAALSLCPLDLVYHNSFVTLKLIKGQLSHQLDSWKGTTIGKIKEGIYTSDNLCHLTGDKNGM